MRSVVTMVLCGLMVATLASCEEEDAPPPRYPFSFTANSDGEPLAGVTITANSRSIGETNAEGVLRRDLTGPPGSPLSVNARCPEGHRSPQEPQMQTLRQVIGIDPAAGERGIQVSFDCPPEMREAVVIVRTGDFADLPIFVDGREMARTDQSGTAHLAMTLAPRSSFEVRIATNTVNERLRPREPSRSFTVPDADQIFVYEQNFEEEAPRRRRRRRVAAPTRPQIPTLITRQR